MGYSATHSPKGQKVIDFFKKEFEYSNETGSDYTKVLACKATPTEAYLAVECNGTVYGMVCLISRRKNEYCNLAYKAMDENCLPYYYNAPKSILDLLSPTTNDNALRWREFCLENITKNEARKTLKNSDTIKFDLPLSFGKLGNTDTFVVHDLKKGHFHAPKFHCLVKLTKSTINTQPWVKVG